MQQHPPYEPTEVNDTTSGLGPEDLVSNKTAKQDEFVDALLKEHSFLYEEFIHWNRSNYDSSARFQLPPPPPLELPESSQVVLITIYSFAAVLSLTGNSLVIFVTLTGNRSKTGLGRYLINLAFSDLFMALFCIPISFTKAMLGHWIFGSALCPLAMFIQVASVAVSIFTNTAIGIDR